MSSLFNMGGTRRAAAAAVPAANKNIQNKENAAAGPSRTARSRLPLGEIASTTGLKPSKTAAPVTTAPVATRPRSTSINAKPAAAGAGTIASAAAASSTATSRASGLGSSLSASSAKLPVVAASANVSTMTTLTTVNKKRTNMAVYVDLSKENSMLPKVAADGSGSAAESAHLLAAAASERIDASIAIADQSTGDDSMMLLTDVNKVSLTDRSACLEPMQLDESHGLLTQHLVPVMPALSLSTLPAYKAARHAARQLPAGVEDVDVLDHDDELQVTEYLDDIFTYLRAKERQDQVDATYMSAQMDLTQHMRAVLINWLIDVNLYFGMMSETLFLTMSILDRHLAALSARGKSLPRSKLQLVGATAVLIASKVEEIYAMNIVDIVTMSSNSFTEADMLKMESYVCNVLGFNFTSPTSLHFFRRFSKVAGLTPKMHCQAKYLIELALCEYGMLRYLPSMVAAAAVLLTRRLAHRENAGREQIDAGSFATAGWTKTLEFFTHYSEAELMACTWELNRLLGRAKKEETLQAVHTKYNGDGMFGVGSTDPLALEQQHA